MLPSQCLSLNTVFSTIRLYIQRLIHIKKLSKLAFQYVIIIILPSSVIVLDGCLHESIEFIIAQVLIDGQLLKGQKT